MKDFGVGRKAREHLLQVAIKKLFCEDGGPEKSAVIFLINSTDNSRQAESFVKRSFVGNCPARDLEATSLRCFLKNCGKKLLLFAVAQLHLLFGRVGLPARSPQAMR